MVVKLAEKMGYFGGEKEEEEGGVVGVVVVVVVGMEEEMEEKVVEGLVEMEGGRVAGQGKHHGCFFWVLSFSLAVGDEEGKKE